MRRITNGFTIDVDSFIDESIVIDALVDSKLIRQFNAECGLSYWFDSPGKIGAFPYTDDMFARSDDVFVDVVDNSVD
jgi:hypothetical protein